MSAIFESYFLGEGVGDIFFWLHVTVLHLRKWRCSQKADHFEKELSYSSHQFSGDMLVFTEVTSKNMHRKSASVSSKLFPICSWDMKKNYLNETEWNHLDFRKTPRKKKRPPKATQPRYGRRFPSTELSELPLPLERSNFTSGHSSV